MLTTERLTLRRPVLADASVVGDLLGDAEVVRFLGGQTATPDEFPAIIEKWIDRWDEYGMGPFMVERDGVFVGRTGVLVWDKRVWEHDVPKPPPEFRQHEIGWAFVRAAWGNGYATESARAVLDWARAQGITDLASIIAPANVRSQRVAERLGATPAETIERPIGAVVVWRYPNV